MLCCDETIVEIIGVLLVCLVTKPDNLVPALKKKHYFYFWALFSAQQKSHYFEH